MKNILATIKEYFRIRLIILKSSIIATFQIETSYWSEGWSSILSTTAYTLAQLLFINVLYSNVTIFAGYTKDEMLVFFFISQIWAYTIFSMYLNNIAELIGNINNGNLDLILTKPLPTIFYTNFNYVSILKVLRDGIPPMTIIFLSINWSNIHITFGSLIVALALLFLGLFADSAYLFLLAIPSFWLGDSAGLYNVGVNLSDKFGHTIPFEGWDKKFKVIFSMFVPILIVTAMTSSVLLGKSDPMPMLLIAVVGTTIITIIRSLLWRVALRNYSSASS